MSSCRCSAASFASNRLHLELALEKVLATGKRRVGIIGLSFKTGTDDLRESPMVALAEHLIGKGLSLLVYDPDVHLSRLLGANKRFIEQHLPHIGNLHPPGHAGRCGGRGRIDRGFVRRSGFRTAARGGRKDQIVVDLARIPDAANWPCTVEGLCW